MSDKLLQKCLLLLVQPGELDGLVDRLLGPSSQFRDDLLLRFDLRGLRERQEGESSSQPKLTLRNLLETASFCADVDKPGPVHPPENVLIGFGILTYVLVLRFYSLLDGHASPRVDCRVLCGADFRPQFLSPGNLSLSQFRGQRFGWRDRRFGERFGFPRWGLLCYFCWGL